MTASEGSAGHGTGPTRRVRLPPRWFIRTAWHAHRAYYRMTGGRRGLWLPTEGGKFGAMRLHTIGRTTGKERAAILGYYEDGPALVTLAMNGWGEGDPAWWLNLLAHPDASVDLKDGTRSVRARTAEGEERDRLWVMFGQHTGWGEGLEPYAALRSTETAVVVLEPLTKAS
ncbi:MAG: nitroreductase family deazaflavin-dependent oxidoreductase [Chloroflexi bacterium]|nr:nitroreductase family deazaflavin-dependent oxidoreductase [Chloroflexota bacterium]